MSKMKNEVATFALRDLGECVRYSDTVNEKGVRVSSVVDSLTKEGDIIRVVDYRKPEGREVYTPPIS
jgi:hypothetical protein